MIEKKKLPQLALSAINLIEAEHKRNVQLIANQTIEAMGLGGVWQVNFAEGVVFREVPDIPSNEDA